MFDVSRAVAGGAIALSWVVFALLCLAVLGALLEAGRPGWDMRVCTALRSALSVALRAFLLVTLALVTFLTLAGVLLVALFALVKGVIVTYGHTFRGDRPTDRAEADGRHRPGFGRMRQGAGRHRMA